jgi:transcriptional regulator with XRE-family HTH domain
MDELTVRFSKNLRALRFAQRVPQVTLARRAKLSVSYISMLERGDRVPTLPTICLIAKALKVKPVHLLQDLDVPEAPGDGRTDRVRNGTRR